MPKTIIGTFIMKDEGDGCLTSKHLEEKDNTPFVECCKVTTVSGAQADPFVGDYTTCWIEPRGVVINTTLKISMAAGNIYLLDWGAIAGLPTTYSGKAMMSEGKLVGVYWDN